MPPGTADGCDPLVTSLPARDGRPVEVVEDMTGRSHRPVRDLRGGRSVMALLVAVLVVSVSLTPLRPARAQAFTWCPVGVLNATRGASGATNAVEVEVPAGATLRVSGVLSWVQGNPITVKFSAPFGPIGAINPNGPPLAFSSEWTNSGSSKVVQSVYALDSLGFLTGVWNINALFEVGAAGRGCEPGEGLGDRLSDGQAGDPVSTSSGNLHYSVSDAVAPGGLGEVRRTYNSRDGGAFEVPGLQRPSIFGRGWSSTVDAWTSRLGVGGAGSTLLMRLPDGRRYAASGGTFSGSRLYWTPPPELLMASVSRDETSGGGGAKTYEWVFQSGEVWSFDAQGRLVAASDPYGPDLAVVRAANGFPTRVVFSEGNSVGWAVELSDANNDRLVDRISGPFDATLSAAPADTP